MRRSYFNDKKFTSQGLVEANFSFVTNNTSNPDSTLFRGCGGLTGAQSSQQAGNASPSTVASITYVSTGRYRVTLTDGFRFVQSLHVSIDDAADALIVRNGTVSNEGSGATTPLVFDIYSRAAASSTLTDSTGRRISVTMVLKASGNGA